MYPLPKDRIQGSPYSNVARSEDEKKNQMRRQVCLKRAAWMSPRFENHLGFGAKAGRRTTWLDPSDILNERITR